MRITLLRATTDPDPKADRGEHSFTYSLYPHQGDYASGGTVRASFDLNVPLRTALTSSHGGNLPASVSLFRVDSDHAILDTVKKAEADGSIILRFYEAHNKRGRVSVSTDLPVRAAHECDLLEREIGKVDVREGVISFDIAPFEIKTIQVVLG
jgi:alpha-mannosidase